MPRSRRIPGARRVASGGAAVALVAALGCAAEPQPAPAAPDIAFTIFYDFEHPVPGDPTREADQGASGTPLHLVNGGAEMRVRDGAHPGSTFSLQTRQVNPEQRGNDDWKAGIYAAEGVASMSAFNGVAGVTIMGWVKRTGDGPAPNSESPDPDDRYNAIGLMGILSGNSDGHAVRALLELIEVNGTLRLVALGRRLDPGQSQTFAASAPWEELVPLGEWTHLAATFDFTTGEMALYRNGLPLEGFYTVQGDPWELGSEGATPGASPTNPRGIKIGGSFPQNDRERNPFDGRFDDIGFVDRVLTADEVRGYYEAMKP